MRQRKLGMRPPPEDTVGALLSRCEGKILAATDEELGAIIGQLRGLLAIRLKDGQTKWAANRLLHFAEEEELKRVFRF